MKFTPYDRFYAMGPRAMRENRAAMILQRRVPDVRLVKADEVPFLLCVERVQLSAPV